ncbi:MAG: HDIG domain-containing protein [Clostridiales bacterium]|nr:HDIG domain-containing protein [Clostridiales bacterium]
MTEKETVGREWTKADTLKSSLWFLLHFIIYALLALALLIGDKFSYLGEYFAKEGANYLYAGFCTLLLFVVTYFYFLFENKELLVSGKMIALLFTVLDVHLVLSCLIGYNLAIYARPVALVALLIVVLIGRREAIFMNVIASLLVFVIDTFAVPEVSNKECYSSLIIAFTAGMMALFLGSRARTRFSVVGIGILIVIPMDVVIFLLEVTGLVNAGSQIVVEPTNGILTQMGFGLFGGVMSTVIFLTLLPIFESIFNRLTVFRLRELISSDAKILQKLKAEAPGTYNHSMMVAQLAEASAAAIGENVDFARAAALYHDVGKLHYPEHFTENQGEYNLHDELTPELSADIIRSHAKDGYTLIRNHHLPTFLADIAVEHHGTLPIRYFYAKALKMTDGELNIEDFSYMGPKPQSKLAAIIMICDASEAAVRAVNARTPEEAEKVIRAVIEERMDLEQFSECDITMADLTKIRLALVNALTGVYHHRIKYPNLKYRRTENGTKGENQ